MAAKKDAWYLGSRAESLALMYLTRRGDLKIERPSQDYGLDFMVVIPKGQAYSGRILGIETRAAVSARKTGKSAIALPAHIARGESSHLNDIPFPVCLFFFTMEDDQGYYKWVKEPPLVPKDSPRLLLNKGTELKKLTNREIDKIISKVTAWYDGNETVRSTT